MSMFDQMADELARDVIKVQDELGDDRLYEEVQKLVAASSTTLEEAFMQAIRVRLAERRARKFLMTHLKKARTEAAARQDPEIGADGSKSD